MVDNNRKQDGPSLESSVHLSMTLRYLGPWDPGSLGPLDLGTLVPPPSSYLFSYSPPLVWFGMVRYGGRGSGGVEGVSCDIGDGIFILGVPKRSLR